MNDRTDFPPEVAAALAKPIQRILDKIKKETDLREELDDPFVFDGRSYDFVEGAILTHFENYIWLVGCWERWLSEVELGDDIAAVYRTVGRFEAGVETLRVISAELRSWRAFGEYAVARNLLASVYEHLLYEIQSHLEKIVEFTADPSALSEKQAFGAPGPAGSSRITIEHDARTMETELALEMTTAPSVSELGVWMRRMRRREERRLEAMGRTRRSKRKSAESTSFLLGGLVGLGLGLSDDDD